MFEHEDKHNDTRNHACFSSSGPDGTCAHLVQACTQVLAYTVGLVPYQSQVSVDTVYYYPCPQGNPTHMYFISNHARKTLIGES